MVTLWYILTQEVLGEFRQNMEEGLFPFHWSGGQARAL